MLNKIKIAISGKSGCGNTTVSRQISRRLGIRLVNYTFHDLARERGLTFEQLCLLAEEDPQYDRFLDKKQVELASHESCVLGSRLAIWLIKEADLKIYLAASPGVRAERIANREKVEYQISYDRMMERDNRDRKRYIRLYGIDIDKLDFADLFVVNTEEGDQSYVVDQILGRLKDIQRIEK